MKTSHLLVAAVAILLVISGVVYGIGNWSEKDDIESNGTEAEEISYATVEDLASLPEAVGEAVEHLKLERGYFVFNEPAFDTGDKMYIMVSSGERPTGGYEISIEKVQLKNGVLEILVQETEPGEDEIVTQALTYPHKILSLEEEFTEIRVFTTEREEFTHLAEAEIEAPKVERESGVEPVDPCDPREGESFLEGEILELDLENRKMTLEVHEGPDTPDAGPEIRFHEEVEIRRLEEIEDYDSQESTQKETVMKAEELEPGMVVGLILTPEKEARAVIVHVF